MILLLTGHGPCSIHLLWLSGWAIQSARKIATSVMPPKMGRRLAISSSRKTGALGGQGMPKESQDVAKSHEQLDQALQGYKDVADKDGEKKKPSKFQPDLFAQEEQRAAEAYQKLGQQSQGPMWRHVAAHASEAHTRTPSQTCVARSSRSPLKHLGMQSAHPAPLLAVLAGNEFHCLVRNEFINYQ